MECSLTGHTSALLARQGLTATSERGSFSLVKAAINNPIEVTEIYTLPTYAYLHSVKARKCTPRC